MMGRRWRAGYLGPGVGDVPATRGRAWALRGGERHREGRACSASGRSGARQVQSWSTEVVFPARSGEGWQPSQGLERLDEALGPGIGAGQAQHEAPAVGDDSGGHVQEREAKPLAPAGREGLGQGEEPRASGPRCRRGRPHATTASCRRSTAAGHGRDRSRPSAGGSLLLGRRRGDGGGARRLRRCAGGSGCW